MYKLLLCSRYLRTRFIALASIISVMLGVATMIVVNSVMAGFSTEMRSRIHGILADVVVEASTVGMPDAKKNMDRIQEVAGEYIEAMSPTVEVYGILTFSYGGQYISRPVTIIGIDPASKAQVGTLRDHLENYKPVRDREGKEIGPPRLSLSQPPNWDLLPDFQKARKQRNEERRIADTMAAANLGNPHNPGPEKATEEDPFPKLKVEADPFLGVKRDPADAPTEDPDAPLPGRIYVGAGLISFQYEDKETHKVLTKMMVLPGDDLKISTVGTGTPPSAVHFPATVVDVFKSGMSEYDSNRIYMNLDYLQQMRGMIDENGTRSVTTIQIRLKNYQDADKVVKRLQSAFPPGLFSVQTWEDKQGPLLAAVEMESTILNVLLFLIIAVAGFGILAIFFMIVVEKTRDIGVLKALGASSRGVMAIFLSYGLSLGLVGAGVGVAVGLLFVKYINQIEAGLTWLTGRKVFDQRIYYFPTIPTAVSANMVIWVGLGAVIIAVLASILPARRAARLHPVLCLRYE